ncbi:MAG: helix-turn-helix domain-containing protein [Pseudomonadota bacterium]
MGEFVAIPSLLTEREAAARLGISLSMLQRLRRLGEVSFIQIGRLIRYRETQLTDYLEASTCPRKSGRDNSENTGFQSAKIPRIGAGHGSTPILDRRAAKALALQTLRKQSSNSPDGSLNTGTDRASGPSK